MTRLLLSALLVLASPGLPAYQALAAVRAPKQAPTAPKPVLAVTAAAGWKGTQAAVAAVLSTPDMPAASAHAAGVSIESFLTGTRPSAAVEPSAGDAASAETAEPKAAAPKQVFLDRPELAADIAGRRRALRLRSAAGIGGSALLAAGAGTALLAQSGADGMTVGLSFLAVLAALPMVGELFSRLSRRAPKDLPDLDAQKHAELHQMVADLSARAKLPKPALKLWEQSGPNAGAIGVHTPVYVSRSLVVFTPTILNTMPARELAAIVGHELTHIKQHDIVIKLGLGALGLGAAVAAAAAPLAFGAIAAVIAADSLLRHHVGRLREYLADLGGAALTGRPAAMAKALLRLEVWKLLVAGLSFTPMTGSALTLAQEHPPTLRRVEAMRRLEQPGSPAASPRGPGSRGGALAGFLAILGLAVLPVLMGAIFARDVPWIAVALFFAMAGSGAALSYWRLRPDLLGSALRRDRFDALLAHPDKQVRRWAAGHVAVMAKRSGSLAALRAAAESARAAAAGEKEARTAARLEKAAERAEAAAQELIDEGLRLDIQARAIAETSLLRAVENGGPPVPARGAARAAAALLRGARHPPALESMLDGRPGALDALTLLSVRLVDGPLQDGLIESDRTDFKERRWVAPAAAQSILRPETAEVFVSLAAWNAMTPERRAGLLYRHAALVAARRAWLESGRVWSPAEPEVLAVRQALADWAPIRGSRRPPAEDEKAGPSTGNLMSTALREAPSRWWAERRQSLKDLGWSGAALTLAAGGGAMLAAAALGGSPVLAASLGVAGFWSASRLLRLPWKSRLEAALKSTAAWLIPASAALAGTLASAAYEKVMAGLAPLLWIGVAWTTAYVLRAALERGKVSYAAALAAAFGVTAAGLTAVFGDPTALIRALIAAALFVHLARHDRGGFWTYAGAGLALAALGTGLLFYNVLLSLGAVLLAGHLLGGWLTRGLSPAEQVSSKPHPKDPPQEPPK